MQFCFIKGIPLKPSSPKCDFINHLGESGLILGYGCVQWEKKLLKNCIFKEIFITYATK